ncbi:MAG TPA: RHS repeat-associated core domain-containing protein [Pseudomonas sp.]|uniref:RHS repeat-associated core domain-containing protein n=1 Tax=Pseudomonas sp. TaxID=306 RepID=UPI002BDE98A9|nr:RHS repeat-associated core domain-containing protein [Pseudomonas sp.]HWH89004.1 RHS repeat-associated core domain-containing protein [Pseudomonas sp.]
MSARLHNKTPNVSAVDSRGLVVRHIAYYRSSESAIPATARVTRNTYDSAGHLVEQRDPRQGARKRTPNRRMYYTLSGTPLGVACVDSGWSLALAMATGQIGRRWDQHGNLWNMEYDRQLRPVRIDAQSPDQPMRVAERFTYGDNSANSAQRNCCARLVRHDDSAGTLSNDAYALCGEPSSQTRRLLLDSQLPDWPDAVETRDALLEARRHTTHWRYDASGAMLEQTDAAGHTQRYTFNVAGQLKTLLLKIAGQSAERVIISDIEYNAFGQIQSQRAANGVTNRARYDSASGRLCALSAAKGARVLQDLQYTFDAVGNVLSITDKAQPDSYANNQQVQAISRFTYDSLYQLISATGRESQAAITQAKLAPAASMAIPAGELFNYTQHFAYDTGGNLTTLRHVRDGNQYTRNLNIADDSNRLVSWNQGHAVTDTAMGTDIRGNLLSLQPGQPLQWNALGQLAGVTLVSRKNGIDDEELYTYDGSGQRVRKCRTYHGGTVVHRDEVVYLPGLELRAQNRQRLEVITMQAGRCSIRYLHWAEGKPAGMSPGQQMRYSLEDPCGSYMLELDDDASLISQEAYYPFGGTAWSAARSVIEAQYTTVRYSGKERDSSGLYYYGQRYYAPWLQRWISADPAGTVDGLNLFCMVGNNPIRYSDQGGLQKFEALNFVDIADSAIQRAPNAHFKSRAYSTFSTKTGEYLKGAITHSRSTGDLNQSAAQSTDSAQKPAPSSPKDIPRGVKNRTAHAAYAQADDPASPLIGSFFNLPGSPSGKNPFPGITVNETDYTTNGIPSFNAVRKRVQSGRAISAPFAENELLAPSDLGTYSVTNMKVFLDAVESAYKNFSATPLHARTRKLIEAHIEANPVIPIRAGVAGLHADVQAINHVASELQKKENGNFDEVTFQRAMFNTVLYVQKLTVPGSQNFPACGNCTGIIPKNVAVATGLSPFGRHPSSTRARHFSG